MRFEQEPFVHCMLVGNPEMVRIHISLKVPVGSLDEEQPFMNQIGVTQTDARVRTSVLSFLPATVRADGDQED